MGLDVVVASNGAEAWQLFDAEEAHFPIVISDWMMPEMDGLELIRRIRASQGSNYVYTILLTAKSRQEVAVWNQGPTIFCASRLTAKSCGCASGR